MRLVAVDPDRRHRLTNYEAQTKCNRHEIILSKLFHVATELMLLAAKEVLTISELRYLVLEPFHILEDNP